MLLHHLSDSQTFATLDEIVLRDYTRDDLDAMVRLDEACFDRTFRFSKSVMRRFAEAKKAQVLMAVFGEELAGFSILHVERGDDGCVGYLVTLDVAHAYRRHGLGQRLLLEAERKANEAGCSLMVLHVFTKNTGAVALYEKLGYDCVGTDEDFYGAGLHAFVYRKPLS